MVRASLDAAADRTAVPIAVAHDALVLLVGPSGSGKSTFAAGYFPPEAVLSSDAFRSRLAGDPADQSATDEAFSALHAAAEVRLGQGLLTVVDATNLRFEARDPLMAMAWRHGRPAAAIIFMLPLQQCLDRNDARPGRRIPARAVRAQYALLRRAVAEVVNEGFSAVYQLRSVAAIESASVRIDAP